MCIVNFYSPNKKHRLMKNHIYIKTLATIVACLVAVNMWAYDYEQDGIYYDLVDYSDGSGVATVENNGDFNTYSGHVTIPASIFYNGKTYEVTGIGYQAFKNCTELTGVTIPEGVTMMLNESFAGCTALTDITLPSTMYSIYNNAFIGCTALSSITCMREVAKSCNENNFDASTYENATLYVPSGSLSSYQGTLPWSRFSNIQETNKFMVDGICYRLLGNGQVFVTFRDDNYNSYRGNVNIPSSVTYNGATYTVTGIDDYAFRRCDSLFSVTIPSSVTSINYAAFYQCTALRSLDIPNSVTYLGQFCFMNCSALETVSLGNGLDRIPAQCFTYCGALTSIDIPASVKVIESFAFYQAAELTSVSLHEGLDSIYNGVFALCYKLTEISIPASVRHIDMNVFEECTAMTKITVPKTSQHYMDDDGVLFTKVDGRPQSIIRYPPAKPGKHYSLPNTTDTITLGAFEYASLLESVYIPSSVKAMASLAFAYSSLKRVVIDEGLQNISNYSFFGCQMLESLYLPSTVTNIGYQAFYYSVRLNDMTIAVNGEVPTIGEEAFYGLGYYTDNGYTTVYVPDGMASKYAGLNDWLEARGNFNTISSVPVNTEFTIDSLIYKTTDAEHNAMVTDVISTDIYDPGLPPKVAYQGNLCTVTALDSYSFYGCTRIAKVNVPFTVQLIRNYAFYGCSNIESVKLNEGLRTIGGYAFAHINKLRHISIPASTDSIRGSAFIVDPQLTAIEVDSNNPKYTDISYVLYSKDRKRLVAFPDGLTSQYNVPNSTEVIGDEAFRGDQALASIQLPESLRIIDAYAFHDCTGLTEVVVPTGTTSIGRYAFRGCSSLVTAELPSTLQQLGYYAFTNTSHLTTLKVKATVPPTCEVSIDPRSNVIMEPFNDANYNNTTLVVPKGCKAAYQAANVWQKFVNIVEEDFPIPYLRGDVNNDNEVDVSDVTAIISYILGNSIPNFNVSAADANEDGDIDVSDVTLVISFILGNPWPESKGIDMWYLVGEHVGINPWWNDPISVGLGLIPLYPSGQFNAQGKGLLTYTGFFSPDDWIMVIHQPGNWDERAGVNSNGVWGIGEGFDAFRASGYGYYTISMNTATGEFSFTPYTATTPVAHSSMNMPGVYCNWVVDDPAFNMNDLNPQKENHDWMLRSVTFEYDGELKFAADEGWTYNWGALEFPYGIGVTDGRNIPVKAGTYDIFFNDITGHYNFIKK